MKSLRLMLVAVALFMGLSISNANAQTTSFYITANYAWTIDWYNTPSTKQNGNSYSAVAWSTSSASGSHKMWFKVINSAEVTQGSGLLNYLTTDAFKTNLTQGTSYWLAARRENVIDPVTTVTGTWAA